jgi:hypothetical protein
MTRVIILNVVFLSVTFVTLSVDMLSVVTLIVVLPNLEPKNNRSVQECSFSASEQLFVEKNGFYFYFCSCFFVTMGGGDIKVE